MSTWEVNILIYFWVYLIKKKRKKKQREKNHKGKKTIQKRIYKASLEAQRESKHEDRCQEAKAPQVRMGRKCCHYNTGCKKTAEGTQHPRPSTGFEANRM